MLELISIIIFFISYKLNGLIFATQILLASTILIFVYKYLKKEVKKTDIFSLIAILVFGSFTLFLKDPYYIKIKLSIVYVIMGIVLIASEMINKSLTFKTINNAFKEMEKEILNKNNKVFTMFLGIVFIFIAILNYYIALNLSEDSWVNFKLFGVLGITTVSIIIGFTYLNVTAIKIKKTED